MTKQDKPLVIIYTDGACSGNPGPGGWGALLQYGQNSKEIFGFELETTNNRMEITAALEALNSLKKSCQVQLFTDSKYLQQGISEWIYQWLKNNWRKSDKKPVKNADLWQKLYAQLGNHDIVWKWVKGHSENLGNQKADFLAVKGKNEAVEIISMGNVKNIEFS